MAADWKRFFGRRQRPASEPESAGSRRVVVGLGNPGTVYRGTRHNVGFDVVDRLAAGLGVEVRKKKFGAQIGEATAGGQPLLLVKPQEFMNRSGQAVATILGFYKVPLDRLLVVTDDLALEVGRLRLRPGGSAGGHNGLADIIEKVKSQDFARLRIGIGSAGSMDMADYVLSRPSGAERELLDGVTETARQAVLCWMAEGLQAAMNRFNGKGIDASTNE